MKLIVVALTLVVVAQGKEHSEQPPGEIILRKLEHALEGLNQLIVFEVQKYPEEMTKTISDILEEITELIHQESGPAKTGLGNVRDGAINLLYSIDGGGRVAILETAVQINDLNVKLEETAKKFHLEEKTKNIKRGLVELWEVIRPDLKVINQSAKAVSNTATDLIGKLTDLVINSSKEDYRSNVHFLKQALHALSSNILGITTLLVN